MSQYGEGLENSVLLLKSLILARTLNTADGVEVPTGAPGPEASNHKYQTNPRPQIPMTETLFHLALTCPKCFGHWDFGSWRLFGIWCLEFGILGSYARCAEVAKEDTRATSCGQPDLFFGTAFTEVLASLRPSHGAELSTSLILAFKEPHYESQPCFVNAGRHCRLHCLDVSRDIRQRATPISRTRRSRSWRATGSGPRYDRQPRQERRWQAEQGRSAGTVVEQTVAVGRE